LGAKIYKRSNLYSLFYIIRSEYYSIPVMRISILLIFIESLISSCCKEDDIESSQNMLSLQGEWYWLKSCGGIAYQCYTPKSTGQIKIIEYT
jgi:hypothetical protein